MWNRPDPNKKPVVAKKPAKWHGIAALVLVLAAGGVAAWFALSPAESAKPSKASKNSLIKEVAPAKSKTNAVEKVAEKPKKTMPTRIGETVGNYVMKPDGTIYHRTHIITNSAASRTKGPYEIFKRPCNNEIARLLMLPPGAMLIGDRRYNGAFKRNFLKSLEDEPITITPEDTPYQAQLKQDVIAARKDLKDAMDRGEDIEKIMSETRDELKRLYGIKREIEKMYLKERKNCQTEQDLHDLFGACNKMLEEKGIEPLRATNPILRKAVMAQERANAEKASAPQPPKAATPSDSNEK